MLPPRRRVRVNTLNTDVNLSPCIYTSWELTDAWNVPLLQNAGPERPGAVEENVAEWRNNENKGTDSNGSASRCKAASYVHARRDVLPIGFEDAIDQYLESSS